MRVTGLSPDNLWSAKPRVREALYRRENIVTTNELPEWLRNAIICGADGEDDNEGENDPDPDDDSDDGDDGTNEGDDGAPRPEDPTVKLRSALDKERKLRREERKKRIAAEREAKAKADTEASKEEAADLKKAQEELAAASEKTSKLAARLLKKEVNDAILAEARAQKFIDPTDALVETVISEVDVDQDDEDPADIDIDEASVKAAVKKLADKKKHLISVSGTQEPSGGRFNRRQGGDKEKTSEQKLRETYPSLG